MNDAENNEWIDAIFNDSSIDNISFVDVNTYNQYGVVSDIYSKHINVIVDSQDICHQIKKQEELRAELYDKLRKSEFKEIYDDLMRFKFIVSENDFTKVKRRINNYNSLINVNYQPIDIYEAVTLPAITFTSKNVVYEYKSKEVLYVVEGEYCSRCYNGFSMLLKIFARNQIELDQQLKNIFNNFINYIESLQK